MTMRTTPEVFLDQIRSSAKFIAAVAQHPHLFAHMNAVEFAIVRIHELGDDDPVWLDRYDQIRALLARESMTIKQRLLALGEILEQWHVASTCRPGH